MALFISKGLSVHSLISLGDESERNAIMDYPQNIDIKCIKRTDLTNSLAFYLKKESITHLIFQGDNMSISLAVLKAIKQTNCRGILQYHGSPYAYLKKNLYKSDIQEKPFNLLKIGYSKLLYPFKKRKLLKIITNSEYGFVTVSNSVQAELNNLFNTKFKNITSIHNPLSFWQKKQIEIENKEPKIVFISRLERKHKNAFLSVKAWQLIHHKYPEWELQILGDGSLMEKIKNYIKENNINNIALLGEVNNVEYYLERSSISILTSDSEGFGMGLFEAAAHKNALVTTKSYGGVKDFVTDGLNGFFVKRNDFLAMAKKIEELILDKTLREEMAINSHVMYKTIADEDIFKEWTKLLLENDTSS